MNVIEWASKIPVHDLSDGRGLCRIIFAEDFLNALKELQSAQPEREKGEWIRNDNGTWSCNRCHAWIPDEQHYYANWCLHCGADMRGEHDAFN